MTIKQALSRVGLIVLLAFSVAGVSAYQPDYAAGVAINSDASPQPGYSAGETNSRVDDYLMQDEQINLDMNSGTVKVLRTNQKANVNNFVTAVIPLQNASCRELRGLARTICRKEGGDCDNLWYKVDPATGQVTDDQSKWKRYLVVVCPEFQLPYLVKTFQKIDRAGITEVNDGSWKYYYKARHRSARVIEQLLATHVSPDRARAFDDANNAVLFYDQPNTAPLVTSPKVGIGAVDIPLSQMTMDTKIYEADSSDDLNAGFDFDAWKNGPGQNLFRFIAWDVNGSDLGKTPADVFQDWGNFRSYNFTATTAWIDFMATKGYARLMTHSTLSIASGAVGTLSNTSGIITFNTTEPSQVNTPASLTAANTVNFDSSSRDGAVALHTPNYGGRDMTYDQQGKEGVDLSLRPIIGLESAEVAVNLHVASLNGNTPSGEQIISHRNYTSSLVARDGVPLAITGIKSTSMVDGTIGMPYLVDIPYVGKYLFGKTSRTQREKEIVVLMTPHFQVYSMDDAKAPQEVTTAKKLANGEEVLSVPANSYGYDQWLLDPAKP